jgi:hypothetical protein
MASSFIVTREASRVRAALWCATASVAAPGLSSTAARSRP